MVLGRTCQSKVRTSHFIHCGSGSACTSGVSRLFQRDGDQCREEPIASLSIQTGSLACPGQDVLSNDTSVACLCE